MSDDASPSTNADVVRIRGNGYTAEAGWFGPDDRPRFGWLYRPDTPARNGVGSRSTSEESLKGSVN